MGFGTLLIGFALMINFTYYSFTDLIVAMLCLVGLSKLKRWNKPFLFGFISACLFCAVGLAELMLEVAVTFFPTLSVSSVPFDVAHYLSLLLLTESVTLGIRSLAAEVGRTSLKNRCEWMITVPVLVYGFMIALSFPMAEGGMTALFAGVVIVFFVVMWLINLLNVLDAYRSICMPEDVDMPEKPSRFGFVNRFREKQNEKEEELKQYKIARMKQHAAKRKKGGKRK